jgi:hypothetical protein
MGSTTLNMVGPNADLDFYFTGINKAYVRALKGQNRAFYTQIAYVPPAGKMTTERFAMDAPNGGSMTGTRVKFPIRLAASRPRVWPLGQPRPVEQFAAIELQVDMQRYCPPAKREAWVNWSNDLIGLIKEQLPDMMDRSIILWDEVLAEAFASNAAWRPDGLPFFSPSSAPHRTNPAKVLSERNTFYNDISVTGIDAAEMRKVYNLLTTQPGPDGVVLDTDEVEIVVIAPDDDMGFQLKQVFQGAITAEAVGANAAAGVSNSLQGAATVKVWKVLSSTIAQPTFGGNAQDRGKVGYMLAVPRSEGKPVAVVPSIQPTAYYTGANGSDHLRASMGEIEFGWDAYGAALLAIAQRAVRFVLNPS